MFEASWHEAVEKVRPYVVRISTPEGRGTGFLFAFARDRAICGIATAAHALSYSHAWELPIRIEHLASGQVRLLHAEDRAILIDEASDTAAIVCGTEGIPYPTELLPLAPEEQLLKMGIQIGWLGFPAVAKEKLCFFSGRISAWLDAKDGYFVDGVAINGVSGGPAFHFEPGGSLVITGVVSAYVPNKVPGTPLPGLSVVKHVGQVQRVVRELRGLDEGIELQKPVFEPTPLLPLDDPTFEG